MIGPDSQVSQEFLPSFPISSRTNLNEALDEIHIWEFGSNAPLINKIFNFNKKMLNFYVSLFLFLMYIKKNV